MEDLISKIDKIKLYNSSTTNLITFIIPKMSNL